MPSFYRLLCSWQKVAVTIENNSVTNLHFSSGESPGRPCGDGNECQALAGRVRTTRRNRTKAPSSQRRRSAHHALNWVDARTGRSRGRACAREFGAVEELACEGLNSDCGGQGRTPTGAPRCRARRAGRAPVERERPWRAARRFGLGETFNSSSTGTRIPRRDAERERARERDAEIDREK